MEQSNDDHHFSFLYAIVRNRKCVHIYMWWIQVIVHTYHFGYILNIRDDHWWNLNIWDATNVNGGGGGERERVKYLITLIISTFFYYFIVFFVYLDLIHWLHRLWNSIDYLSIYF